MEASRLIKANHPNVSIGGPAVSSGDIFFPCGGYDGIQKWWIDGFLNAVKESNAPLDFFSWHYYGGGTGHNLQWNSNVGEFTAIDPTVDNMTYWYTAHRETLSAAGFNKQPMVLTEWNSRFVLGNNSAYTGSLAGAALNVAKLSKMMSWDDMHAAFLHEGRVGAYAKRNPLTFPLFCSVNMTVSQSGNCTQESSPSMLDWNSMDRAHPGCGPEAINIVGGEWSDCDLNDLMSLEGVDACQGDNYLNCQFGPGPETGLGAAYADGVLTPNGEVFSVLKNAQGSQFLKLAEPAASELEQLGVYAIAWQPTLDARYMSILLANTRQHRTSKLPSVKALLTWTSVSGVVGASRFVQYERGNFESGELDGIQGLQSRVALEGGVADATAQFCSNGSEKLPALEPFQIVLLAVSVDDGCKCSHTHQTANLRR